ncbi:MAG TPA: DUF3108 domain-containing protein [Microvirga sp.]|jgi:hypothetical protein
MRPSLVTSLVLALGAAAPAGAQTLKVDYGISLAGLPMGTADLSTTLDGSRYRMQVGAKLTGLAGMITGGKGGATATGAVGGGQPVPASFAITSRASSGERTVRMGLSGGNVAALDINPPIDEKPDRVPLAESHKRGVVDPVSALIMPAVKADPLDPANCNRTLPIFDGAARFDVVLTYGETRPVEKPGYKGQVLVCNARYVPIAGHRALRPSTKFMQENRDLQVWLAPVEGSRLLMPMRIAVRTMVGMSVIEAERWALADEPKGAAPRASRASVAQ